MRPEEPACTVSDLTVAYRAQPVLRAVNLTIPAGTVMGVVGPNGAGKSTLIKAMLGLVKPLAGRVCFDGETLTRARRRVGYMPQSSSVDWDFPATALDVVEMGTYGHLGWLRRPGAKERERARESLAEVGLADLASRQIGELSGGQRQRVFLARTLAQQPNLYLLDEPFQGVDVKSRHAIVTVLRRIRDRGKSVVMVLHDLTAVPAYCDQVALLNRGVIASGPTHTVFTTENIRATYDVVDSPGEVPW